AEKLEPNPQPRLNLGPRPLRRAHLALAPRQHLAEARAQRRPEDLVLARVVEVDRSLGHARFSGDQVHRGVVEAVLAKDLPRRLQNFRFAELGERLPPGFSFYAAHRTDQSVN